MSLKSKKSRSLEVRVFVALGMIMAVFIFTVFMLLNTSMSNLLLQSEEKYLEDQLHITENSLKNAQLNTYWMADDTAIWDETVSYVEGNNPDYFSKNWPDTSLLSTYQYHFILITDKNGDPVHVEFYDFINDTEMETPTGFANHLKPVALDVMGMYEGSPPASDDVTDLGKGGIFFLDGVPYFVAAMPVMPTHDSTDPVGTFMFGNILSDEYFVYLTHFDSIDFNLEPGIIQNAAESRDQITTSLALTDIDDAPVTLQMTGRRVIYADGMSSITNAMLWLILLLAAFIVMLYFFIKRMLINPVKRISRDIQNLDLSRQLSPDEYTDSLEFLQLSNSINSMLSGLNESNVSMTVMQAILNSIDAFVYVSDPETDEILFINDKMMSHFDIENGGITDICWKVLQSGMEERCDFCPVSKLMADPDKSITWEEHNTVTGRYYQNTDRLIDWADNRKVHLQYSIDITDAKEKSESLERRLEQQELTSAISQTFISTEELEPLIDRALEMTGKFLNAGKIVIAGLYNEHEIGFKYGWINEEMESAPLGVTSMPYNEDNPFYKAFKVERRQYIMCEDASTDPLFAYVAQFGVKSFLTAPIYVHGEFWGIINVDNSYGNNSWDQNDVHLLVLISNIISGAITRDLMEKDLIAAKESAELASNAKGDFLSRMSHEMRTPMNAIIGMTSIAKQTDDDAKKDNCLEKIEEASHHLLGVINDILDMSKIEANKLELYTTDFSFEKMLMNTTNVVGFRVDEKHQNLVVHVDGDVPHSIISDEQRLSQVLINLLTNAVKFTPEHGAITMNIRVDQRIDEDYTLRFDVSDTGIGIDKEAQGKLFTSFEQGDGSVSRKFGGTGLGLAISKRIVELMGGKIWVESAPGEGSTFSFTVNVKKGKRKSQLKGISQKWDNLRVLAVDDAAEFREYFRNVAEHLNFHCDVAADGYEACEMIAKNGDQIYNIIFVDWRMPGMDGVELTRKIKETYGDNTIVIMISAMEWSSIEAEAREAGVEKYIQKPLYPSVLANCINDCLGIVEEEMTEADKAESEKDIFRDYRILLAEDYQINREIVKQLLGHTGLQIDEALNGVEAVEKFKNDPDRYDLIFMDIQMPEMDGYEATQQIRSLGSEKARSIPIIAMTANVFKEDVDRSLAAGMDGHLGKPMDIDAVIEILKKYLLGKSK